MYDRPPIQMLDGPGVDLFQPRHKGEQNRFRIGRSGAENKHGFRRRLLALRPPLARQRRLRGLRYPDRVGDPVGVQNHPPNTYTAPFHQIPSYSIICGLLKFCFSSCFVLFRHVPTLDVGTDVGKVSVTKHSPPFAGKGEERQARKAP